MFRATIEPQRRKTSAGVARAKTAAVGSATPAARALENVASHAGMSPQSGPIQTARTRAIESGG